MSKDTHPEESRTESWREAYGWFEPALADRGDPPPLVLVGRALCLMDHLISQAMENGESTTWVTYGLREIAETAARTGDWSGLGVMFTGLETLIEAEYRKGWPLSGTEAGGAEPTVEGEEPTDIREQEV